MLYRLGRALRILIGCVAAGLLIFSFGWVLQRPFRKAKVAAGQTQLTIIHWGDKNEDHIVAKLVEDFESQPENAGIRILRINPGQADKVNTKLQTMFAAGDPPDMFYLGYEKVADLAQKDLLADIEELIQKDTSAGRNTIHLSDFFPAVIRSFRYDDATQRIGTGKLVALPKDFTPVGFYYNKKLFKKAGVPEPSPNGWTWDEFVTAARAIGKLENCYGADFVTWEAMVRIYLWNHDCDVFGNSFDDHRFNDPKVQSALEKLRGWFHDEPRTLLSAKTQLETGQEPFLAGNIGMAGPYGRWKTPTFRLITDFDWDLAPMPHEPGVKPRNGIFTAGWAMAKAGKHQEAAWRFVKYACSARGQELMCSDGLAIPVLKDVANGPTFSDPTQKPKNYRVFLDAAEYADPIDVPSDPQRQYLLRVRLEEIFKLGRPVKPTMAALAREWNEGAITPRQPMPWRTVVAAIGFPMLGLFVAGVGVWWLRRPRGMIGREELAGSWMVSPWVIGFVAFCVFPIVLSLLLAFTKWSGLTTLDMAHYVGFDNFRAYWANGRFRHALFLTALYALIAVPTSQLAALGAALLMNREWKSIGTFRAVWYLPSVLAGVGMAVMWRWVFHHEHGLLRMLMDPLLPAGMHTPAWLEKDAAQWGVPAFAIINLWSIGGTMMIYLAGLKGISNELYEAASIDGATGWRRFSNVTLPMLSPVILFNVIIAVIASFQVFTQAYVMTGGGPGDATRFYVVYLYNQAFDFHDMGYASGMAWILLLIVLVLTMTLMGTSRKFVHYEGLKA